MKSQDCHYGDLIRSRYTKTDYYVRAVAHGYSVVVAPSFYPLGEMVSDQALIILRDCHLENFDLVTALTSEEYVKYLLARPGFIKGSELVPEPVKHVCSCPECAPELHYGPDEQARALAD